MQLNSSVFLYDYQDHQAAIQRAIGQGLDNMKQIDIVGIDVDLLWQPTDNLYLQAGLGWIDAQIKSDEIVAGLLGAPTSVLNTVPSDAPELTFNTLVRYVWPLSNARAISAQADASFSDDVYRQLGQNPLTFVESYWLVNARATMGSEDKKWEVELWGRTLTDEPYFIQFTETTALGHVEGGPGAPRTYGVTMSYHFF
jgi:iron complex outermembrane receptor protein